MVVGAFELPTAAGPTTAKTSPAEAAVAAKVVVIVGESTPRAAVRTIGIIENGP